MNVIASCVLSLLNGGGGEAEPLLLLISFLNKLDNLIIMDNMFNDSVALGVNDLWNSKVIFRGIERLPHFRSIDSLCFVINCQY